jgi:uncharacterized membrane-anchored protein
MRRWTYAASVVLGAVVATLASAGRPAVLRAQEPEQGPRIEWEEGPAVATLGDVAKISIPAGYRFTGPEGARKVLELTQNTASGNELGILTPMPSDDGAAWFVIFTFRKTGYVKDTEGSSLDARKILETISRGTEESNAIRKRRGWGALHVVGWAKAPYYDPETHNLTWAIRGRAEGEGEEGESDESINYSTRVLGREGTMSVELVIAPEQFDDAVEQFNTILTGFSYTPGHTYAEWKAGDPVAKYGLTALIVGGAGAVALKSGVLAKFWKLIVIGVAAAAGALKRMVANLFGKRGEAPATGG